MLVLVQIDLSGADLALFGDYETQALALLGNHGGQLLERLRSTDASCEVHLLSFPDANALGAFRADPARAAFQEIWSRCGASSNITEVHRLSRS
jgi:hypothetical protein